VFRSKKLKTANIRNGYATHDDVCDVFEKDTKHLYLLAFLLTANHGESEQCFVSTVESDFKAQAVFKEWARPWVKRRMIKNAIETVSPASARNGPKRDLWNAGQRETQGECEIDIVTKLAAFDRFVFVMSILERYSNWDCSMLLGCSINKVAQARMRALGRLPELVALLPRREGPPSRRRLEAGA
jgi:DNA-directed RNA polymerase specialized sigma24 family protein